MLHARPYVCIYISLILEYYMLDRARSRNLVFVSRIDHAARLSPSQFRHNAALIRIANSELPKPRKPTANRGDNVLLLIHTQSHLLNGALFLDCGWVRETCKSSSNLSDQINQSVIYLYEFVLDTHSVEQEETN